MGDNIKNTAVLDEFFSKQRKDKRPLEYVEQFANRSIKNVKNDKDFDEWVKRKKLETNFCPPPRPIIDNSPPTEYDIELTQATPSLISISNISHVSPANSGGTTSATTTPPRPTRRSSVNPSFTPSALIRRKLIAKTKNLLETDKRGSLSGFNPTVSSTPTTSSRNRSSYISNQFAPGNGVDIVSSSDESLKLNNEERQCGEKDKENRPAVEPVSTSEHNIIVPSTQEQLIKEKQNENGDEIIIPETQETSYAERNPVQARVETPSKETSQPIDISQTKTQQIPSPKNVSRGLPPLWANLSAFSPKTNRNHVSRIPVSTNKSLKVIETDEPMSPKTSLDLNRSDLNNKNGESDRIVVAVVNPASPSRETMPSIQLNVNISGAPTSTPTLAPTTAPSLALTTAQTPITRKSIEQIENPTTTAQHSSFNQNESNESLMTNDSDSVPDNINNTKNIATPTSNHNQTNISVKRRLLQSFERSPEIRPEIDNQTYNNIESYVSHRRSSRQLQRDNAHSIGSYANSLPPINSETFDKQKSAVQNATYDISTNKTSSRLFPRSLNFQNVTQDVSSKSNNKRQHTIEITEEHSNDQYNVLTSLSFDNENTDEEIVRITGRANDDIVNASSDCSNENDSVEPPQQENHNSTSGSSNASSTVSLKQDKQSNWNPVIVLTKLPLLEHTNIVNSSRKFISGPRSKKKIRESESFSHVVPPIDFCDEPIINEKSPMTAAREFEMRLSLIRKEQANAAVNRSNISQTKKRRTHRINPELEAVNKTHAEIKQKRSSSLKRVSSGRKLYSQQYDQDEQQEASTSSTSQAVNGDDDVFKRPTMPLSTKHAIQHSIPSISSASHDSYESEIIISRTDSPTNFNDSDSDGESNALEQEKQQKAKQPTKTRKTKTLTKRPTALTNRSGITTLNIIPDDKDDASTTATTADGHSRKSRRTAHFSARSNRLNLLKQYYTESKSSKKRVTIEPADGEQPSKKKRINSLSIQPSTSKKNTKNTNDLSSNEDSYINEQWNIDICDMSKNQQHCRSKDGCDMDILQTNSGKRIEIVRHDQLEFLDISEGSGIEIGVVSSEHPSKLSGFMRFNPTTVKTEAISPYDMKFCILSGTFLAAFDGYERQLISGTVMVVPKNHRYSFRNIDDGVSTLYFIFNKNN